jgi:HlyD family secretion protein
LDSRQKDLSVLQIDRSQKESLAPAQGTSWRRWLFLGLGVIVLVAAGLVVSRVFARAPEVTVQRVRLEHGAGTTGNVVLTAGGYIVAHHTIQVSSKIVGKVAWVGIEKGDRVKEGQVLVRLEDSEYRAQWNQAKANLEVAQARLRELETGSRPQEIDAARAAVAEAQSTLQNAEINLKRAADLVRQEIAPQQQLDNARTQYEVAKARLESAQKNYDLVKIGPRSEQIEYARAQVAQMRAAVDYAQTMLDSTLIRAPVTGTVLERSIEKGELVSTMNFGGTGGVKASVCSLADLNDLQVELDINQNDFPRIAPRQECLVTADAYPDRVYKGVVEEIAPQANRQKATIQVKVKILTPDEYLRPEMNAHVSFLSPSSAPPQSSSEILTIPRSATVQSEGKRAVFVLAGKRVELREVQIGRDLGDRLEIIQGLGPNDRVVVQGLEGLTSGQRVKVKSGA